MSPSDAQMAGAHGELTKEQIDIIGEINNVSMGSAATALSNIMGKKVTITSPHVEAGRREVIERLQQIPSVGVLISYTSGVVGTDFLMLRQADAEEIVKVLMGGEVPGEEDFGELHISAIGEVMNQMMGSAATALSGFIGKSVNISPPSAFILTDENKEEKLKFLYDSIDELVFVKFLFHVEGMFESELYVIMTRDFSTELVDVMLRSMGMALPQPEPAQSAPSRQVPPQTASTRPASTQPVPAQPAPPQPVPARPAETPILSQSPAEQAAAGLQAAPTIVRPAVLPSFEPRSLPISGDEEANFGLIQNVPLELSVEVGRARKLVREVIDFSVGTIIELDKQAGDPVDIIVNGQLIAHGEVVVIDESFGVRVTEIVNTDK